MSRLINFLLYQIGWFCCVLGAAWQFPWVGMCVALSLVGIHFLLATDRGSQLRLVASAACVGLLLDSTQLWAGVFSFQSGIVVPWLPPPWMSVLWMQFATTLHYSMRWLSGRYILAACFGLAGAPLAFFAGERLGAIQFLSPRLLHYALLGVLWSGAVPLLVCVSDYLLTRGAFAANYRWVAASGRASN